MKTLIAGACALAWNLQLTTASEQVMESSAEQPTILFMVDPNDLSLIDEEEASASPAKEPETLKELVDRIRDGDPTLTKKQKRIIAQIEKEQREYIDLLQRFTRVNFDAEDEKADPEFTEVRDRLVDLLFNSPTEKDFLERLYLVNALWLENQTELERFSSLDRALSDRATDLDAKRRKYQAWITAGASIAGAAAGGIGAWKWSGRIVPIAATDKGWSLAFKWIQRTPVIIAGLSLGALAGRYAGFLGSDYILQRMNHDYFDPIDGNTSFKDFLDLIDNL